MIWVFFCKSNPIFNVPQELCLNEKHMKSKEMTPNLGFFNLAFL